jgi:hypothetical protein
MRQGAFDDDARGVHELEQNLGCDLRTMHHIDNLREEGEVVEEEEIPTTRPRCMPLLLT